MTSDKGQVITDAINAMVKLGGTRVSDEEYQRRLEICRGCELVGTVEVMGHQFEGCTECGCPLATKPLWQEFFSVKAFKFVEAKCPHPNGDKWSAINKSK